MGATDDTAATRDGDGAAHRSAVSDRAVGDLLAGRYKLEAEIGKGGFGVVFLATDIRLDKRVAVKVLSTLVARTPMSLARFKQEATSAARIGHKGIVDVTDVGEDDDGTHFIVMEYIAGIDLGVLLRAETTLPLSRALCIAARIAQALAAAHEQGIVHRDLKPGNVLLTSLGPVVDFVKVLDFGVSKIMHLGDGSDHLTLDGQVVGTPRYMAPEQGLGDQVVDARVDVYALGTILYEMVTGQVPYTGATPYEVIHNKLSLDPLPPAVVNPEIEAPLAFEELVLRALARDPGERFATMAAFEVAIRELLAEVDPAAVSGVGPAPPTPQPRVHEEDRISSNSVATQLSRHPSRPAGAVPTPSATLPVRLAPGSDRPRRKLRTLLLLGGVAAAAIAALVAMKLRTSTPDASPPARATLPEPPPDPSPVRPQPEPVEIRFVLAPPDAHVEIDGVAVAEKSVILPRSDRTYEVVVRAPGYQSARRTFQPRVSGALEITLEPDQTPVPDKQPRRPRPHNPDPRLPDSPL